MDTLEQLLKLPAHKLHQHAKTMSRRLDVSCYLAGLALVAMHRSEAFRKYHCVDVIQYAVNHLTMARQKANELFRACKALEHLPVLREAFQNAALGWGKIREVTRVATAETDQEWHDYALRHTTEEVSRAVTISPRAFNSARKAADAPPLELLEATPEPARERAQPAAVEAPTQTAPVPKDDPIPPGRKVRMIVDWDPEKYARFQLAEEAERRRAGKRIPRDEVLLRMAERSLAATSSETRAKLPMIVLVDGASGTGWYETREGPLPATPEQVTQALEQATDIVPAQQPTLFKSEREGKSGRQRVPRWLFRALMARARGKCETPGCGRGSPLHVAHKKPVTEGGRNTLGNTRLLCDQCHPLLDHTTDFLPGSPWAKARERNIRKRRKGFQKRSSEASRSP